MGQRPYGILMGLINNDSSAKKAIEVMIETHVVSLKPLSILFKGLMKVPFQIIPVSITRQ